MLDSPCGDTTESPTLAIDEVQNATPLYCGYPHFTDNES